MLSVRMTSLAAASILLPASAFAAPISFTLGDGGASLLRLGPIAGAAAPVSLAIRDSVTGDPVFLTAIDFEKESGLLFGASAANDSLQLINPAAGVATFRAGLPSASDADVIAIDFNNSLDVARVIDTDAATGITALFQIALAADGAGMISITLLRDFGAGADIRGPAVIDSAAIAPVPLPAPLALLAAALAGLAGLRGFRRAA